MSLTNDFWSNPPSNFLASLGEDARAELLVCAKRRQLRKGQHIFRAGSRGENVYILERGRAKIYELSQSGKEVILWFCIYIVQFLNSLTFRLVTNNILQLYDA